MSVHASSTYWTTTISFMNIMVNRTRSYVSARQFYLLDNDNLIHEYNGQQNTIICQCTPALRTDTKIFIKTRLFTDETKCTASSKCAFIKYKVERIDYALNFTDQN
ncbi:hypothetical protein CHS0354_041233 [Potamilus streckersoni]|uniref:Uncharacterized protein n=1 Tax=Potamilus streckersoni TaxID=2493646 RepID=A0AAE0VUZ3_9BIVA|nr:hypothetical protein CHS0354_041233 [Potamilus streckersoni]